MNIGNKIRELRKKRGITQEQLADSIGISFQAVSKWENNISLPDITLAPAIASYFGVSMDELFDFSMEKIKEEAILIAKESQKYRSTDWETARKILYDGLKKYPDNEILLNNLLYVTDYEKDPDEEIRIASRVVDVAREDASRYDAYRFMAYAYKEKGDLESAVKTLDMIPEIYFSRLGEKARVLDGEEGFNAACMQLSESLYELISMLHIMAYYNFEKGNHDEALDICNQALNVLDILKVKDDWYGKKENLKKLIAIIKDSRENKVTKG